jgi:hypothetical protein
LGLLALSFLPSFGKHKGYWRAPGWESGAIQDFYTSAFFQRTAPAARPSASNANRSAAVRKYFFIMQESMQILKGLVSLWQIQLMQKRIKQTVLYSTPI